MAQFIVLIIVILTALACALIGNFLVLRRLSLMGDAISHAILPGIVLAFFIVGSLESPLFFLFAVIFALLMVFVIEYFSHHLKVSQESVIGIVFTALFALGVILIVNFADNVHLDAHAVLYGEAEFSYINRFIVFGVDLGVRSIWTMGLALGLNATLIALFYKELKLTTFDPGMARSLGISVRKMHYLIMAMTSITVVAAFESVGAILVVAFLVVPSATAYIISKRFGLMIGLSLVFGALAAILGYLLAIYVDGSIAGAAALMSGVLLFVVLLIRSLYLKILRERMK